MITENNTSFDEFFLAGLSDISELQFFLFVFFLCVYIVTLLTNIAIITITWISPNLHTPMYFFLANFSFLEMCYISSTLPKMLSNFLAEHKTISYSACLAQMYCFLLLGGTECYMLAAMAYDRYNAICHPLLYSVILTRRTCVQLISASWIIGAINALIHTALTFTLPFCSNKINHFFCDIPPLLKLACTNTWANEMSVFLISGSVIVGSFILTMISYAKIISAILKIRLSSGRKKTFSTCASHFVVVMIFYGSGIFMYFRPKSSYSMSQDRLIAVMYTIIAPLLNPFIYTFRNSDVKVAVNKLVDRIIILQKLKKKKT